MRRFCVFSRDDAYSYELCKKIIRYLEQRDDFLYDDTTPDLVICVGGDGTILRAIHKYLRILDTTCFAGIHTGTLGFLTDYTKAEFDEFLEDMIRDHSYVDTSNLLEITMDCSSQIFYALNEVRIGSFHRSVSYDIYIDGEKFEHTTGSGICISTQAGSTAVNRALCGAVVDDGLELLQFTEIMPISHHSHNSIRNPYIMRADRRIEITGESLSYSEGSYDYLELDVTHARKISVCTSQKRVRFIRYKPYSYLKRIRNLY